MSISAQQRPAPSKRITVVQQKGGVGKTTVAVSLAAAISQRGGDVILVDADPLRSACQWADLGNLPFAVQEITYSTQQPPDSWVAAVKRVSSEYVVVDTPPATATLALALLLADVALIPCTPSGLDLEATERTLDVVKAVRARRSGNPPVILVPNRVDRRTLEGRQLGEELERFGEIVASPIGYRSAFVRSFALGSSVLDYDRHGPTTRELRELFNLVESCFAGLEASPQA